MSTLLSLVQATHNIMRGGNAQPGTQPSAYPIAAGSDQMVYDCDTGVKQAWNNLQNLHLGWKWMRKQGLIALPANVRTMTRAVQIAQVADLDTIFPLDAAAPPYVNMYDAGAATRSDRPVWWIEYENWRGYADRQPQTKAQPSRMTVWPDGTLEFDPTPNVTPSGGVWTISFDYRVTNQALVNGGDIPAMPAKYHDLIAWMAVLWICETRNSTGLLAQLAQREVYGDGKRQGRLDMLEIDQLPPLLIDPGFGCYG